MRSTNRPDRAEPKIDTGMGILDSGAAATATTSALDGAVDALRRAEAEAQVSVAELGAMPDIAAAAALWGRIWQTTGVSGLGPEALRALSYAGNYLAGAMRDGHLVGALAGFFAGNGELYLHSHILGVDAKARSRGVGFALKLHQRVWALERGIARITWTFDPLVSANAYFNVQKLGAEGVEYHANFYGVMGDAINGRDDTDRVLVSWRLRDPVAGDLAALDGAPFALRMRSDGSPLVDDGVAADPATQVVLCAVPRDIVAMRRDQPDLAAAWRIALRRVLSTAFARGLVLGAVGPGGVYVLRPGGES